MDIDIATLLENHRRHMLAQVDAQEYDTDDDRANSRFAIMHTHDRATTKTLLDLYRTTQNPQPTTATNTVTIAPSSRKVKAGSKKARDRAIKAGETRRNNLAAKKADAHGGGVPQDIKDADDALRDAEAHGRDEGGAE